MKYLFTISLLKPFSLIEFYLAQYNVIFLIDFPCLTKILSLKVENDDFVSASVGYPCNGLDLLFGKLNI